MPLILLAIWVCNVRQVPISNLTAFFDCCLLFLREYSLRIVKYPLPKPEQEVMTSLWRSYTYKKQFSAWKRYKNALICTKLKILLYQSSLADSWHGVVCFPATFLLLKSTVQFQIIVPTPLINFWTFCRTLSFLFGPPAYQFSRICFVDCSEIVKIYCSVW